MATHKVEVLTGPMVRAGDATVTNDIVKYNSTIIGTIYTKRDRAGSILEQKTIYSHGNRNLQGSNPNWLYNCAKTDGIIVEE